MAVSKELLLAILSMDSYNQGYGAGLQHGQTQIGTATLLGPAGGIPLGQEAAWTAAGFYAAAYNTSYGKVISYRGTSTDTIGATATDIFNGWIAGAGFASAQLEMAKAFYTDVTGQSITAGAAANTILTGHSPGGGLPGAC
jgi:hypothetical protein